jgi:DNA-binding NtrC family response regulator
MGSILVLDEEREAERIQRELAPEHHVVLAHSADEARALLREGAFDMVLCDLNQKPGAGGQLRRWLADHRPDLLGRLVFMGASACSDEVPCLPKPLDWVKVRGWAARLSSRPPPPDTPREDS